VEPSGVVVSGTFTVDKSSSHGGVSLEMKRKIKVLLAKLGLDVHNRGIITVAKQLRNAGMEVVYIGNALPTGILSAAVQEDADVVGVSSLGGAHLTLGRPLVEEARKMGMLDRTVFVAGGVFAPVDGEDLRSLGFDGIFTPGATEEEIVSSIRNLVSAKRQPGR
jgi:methylmalonyl-CoA mutase, C-terminal domain